jgi:hypothetical protein
MIGLNDDESTTWTETAADGTARAVTKTRYAIIREMIGIFERECPWIINLHPQNYSLYHAWYHNLKPSTFVYTWAKYRDIDTGLRRRGREAWNETTAWPAYVFAISGVLLIAPAVRTYVRRTRR